MSDWWEIRKGWCLGKLQHHLAAGRLSVTSHYSLSLMHPRWPMKKIGKGLTILVRNCEKFSQVVEQCRSGVSLALTFCLELGQIFFCPSIYVGSMPFYFWRNFQWIFFLIIIDTVAITVKWEGWLTKTIMVLQFLLTPKVRVDGVDQKTSLCKSLKKLFSFNALLLKFETWLKVLNVSHFPNATSRIMKFHLED